MRWLLIIFALIGLTSICVGAPTASPIAIETLQAKPGTLDATASSSPSSLSSARKLPTNDVGLPSELAWQAWLVVANKPDAESSFESATVPRRISPKSVFVAPPLQGCPDGYKADVYQRCIKDTIQINYKAHLEFLLQRLKANFPSTVKLDDSAATGPDLKTSAASGPTQVNISLGIEDNWSVSRLPLSSEKIEREVDSDDTVEISVVHVPPVEALNSDQKSTTKTEAVLTQYEVENGSKIGQETEGTFFRGNSSQTFRDHSIREVVVPVAEFIDDGNQTFTEVIDYEIPPSLEKLFNTSQREPVTSEKNITKTKAVEDTQPPTVVLLLSPTKLTAAASTQYFEEPDSRPEKSVDHILVRTGNLKVNSTEKNGVPVDMTVLNFSPEDTTSEENEEVTLTDDEFTDLTTTEIPETVATTIYPEEDPEDATESNDELLDHGEAGMLVSAAKLGPSIHPEESKRQGSKTVEEFGGSISSESSISGDVIIETTLLDLNTGTTPTHARPDDLRELFDTEKQTDSKPEVVFPPQDPRRFDGPSVRGTRRPENPTIPVATLDKSSLTDLDEPSTIDSYPQETVRYVTVHKKHSESDEGPNPSDHGHLQQRRRTTSSHDHVRFPEDPRLTSSSYVLFPSDHSNSINGHLDYKERSSFADDSMRPQLVRKSSVPLHQKKTHWHLPSGWRIDDLQPPRQPVAIQNDNQRQNPMLLRFWTRMPLSRHPSLTMSGQSSRSISPIVTQRESIYRSMQSPQAANRAFSQSVRGG